MLIAGASPVLASADHGSALAEGQRLAGFTGRQPGSADVLLGLIRAGGAAARLLAERGVTAARLEPALAQIHPEPRFSVAHIERASHEIAAHLGAPQTSSLHLLLALLRAGGSAVDLLRMAGCDPAKVRALVLRALTGPVRVDERATGRLAPPGPETPAAGPTRPVAAARGVSPDSPVPTSSGVAAVIATHPGHPDPVSPRPSPRVVPAVAAGEDWELLPVEPPRTPVLHRGREVGRLLDLLAARTARIICVVGDAGEGRSALLAALSAAAAEKPLTPAGALPTGLSPGALLQELHRRAAPDAPVVLDGCAAIGPEEGDGPPQLLATARAGRRWILAATPADVRRFEIGAPELATAFETVTLGALAAELLLEIVEAGVDALAESSGMEFSSEVCRTLVRLAPRYPCERAQPGRSLAIAEVAVARAERLGGRRIGEEEIAAVIADASGVSAARLLRSDDERFRTLEARLADRVVGHEAARARIADVLRRSYAGFRGRRPLASLLLLGPTGVGKTETAKAVADALFDGGSALLRLDLSEYSEPHAVARLIGSPPGYVGYEEGGQLTEAIRHRPASVVLLDELEKAHRDVLLLLLQVLEDGRLTDGRGRTVDFSAAAVVMTSNLGSECYRRNRAPAQSTIVALARSRLPPELWNRIDEVLCYAPLKEAELASIVGRIAADSSRRLEAERGISFHIDASVVAQVLRQEPDRSLGARPLRRAFERLVEGPLADAILGGHVRRGARLEIRCDTTGELKLIYDR
jgi:ATP-dependent Clp protease ATP-binding subunit ClpC